jgi:hypothetical protein
MSTHNAMMLISRLKATNHLVSLLEHGALDSKFSRDGFEASSSAATDEYFDLDSKSLAGDACIEQLSCI